MTRPPTVRCTVASPRPKPRMAAGSVREWMQVMVSANWFGSQGICGFFATASVVIDKSARFAPLDLRGPDQLANDLGRRSRIIKLTTVVDMLVCQ
jgi:hypothetical protein